MLGTHNVLSGDCSLGALLHEHPWDFTPNARKKCFQRKTANELAFSKYFVQQAEEVEIKIKKKKQQP